MTIAPVRGRVAVGASAPAVPAAPIDFDALVRVYRDRLIRIASIRIHDPGMAEDIVQDVLLTMWANRHRYDPRHAAAAWATELTKWQSLGALKRRRDVLVGDDWADKCFVDRSEVDNSTGLPCMAEPETRAVVLALVAKLSPRQRQVVELYCFEGLSAVETGERLGISHRQVHDYMRRAQAALRRLAVEVVR